MAHPFDKAFGWLLAAVFEDTTGSGTSTVAVRPNGAVAFVQNASSGSASSARIRERNTPRVAFDPAEEHTIRTHFRTGPTIDDSENASITLSLTDSTGSDGLSATGDHAAAQIFGNGTIRVETQNDGAANTNETVESNTFVSNMETAALVLNGTAASVEAANSTTTVSDASSINYPTGTDLNVEIEARDANAAAAVQVEFDIERFEVTD